MGESSHRKLKTVYQRPTLVIFFNFNLSLELQYRDKNEIKKTRLLEHLILHDVLYCSKFLHIWLAITLLHTFYAFFKKSCS
jgi:hypothetical protein